MTTTTINVDMKGTGLVRDHLTVDANPFLTALRAIHPHALDDPELPHFRRVRIHAAHSVAGEAEIRVTATNGFTCALARVTDLDETPSEGFVADVLPADAAVVMKMFKPAKDQTITLRVDWHTDHRLTFTDVSGLFDGRAYTIPTLQPESTDVARVIGDAVDGRHRQVERGLVEFTGDLLRRFAASAAAYGDRLTVQPTADNGPYLVHIGAQFIGLLMPQRYDGDRGDRIRDEHTTWAGLLA